MLIQIWKLNQKKYFFASSSSGAVYMQEGEKGIKEEKVEIEWVEGKRWWRFNKILITLLVSGHSPLSFVPVHEKLNCRTWYPWKASPSKSVVIYERVQLINISGPAFNGLTLPTIKIVPNVPRLWLRSKGFCGCRTHFRSRISTSFFLAWTWIERFVLPFFSLSFLYNLFRCTLF